MKLPSTLKKIISFILIGTAFFNMAQTAKADGAPNIVISPLRDTEIENLLQDYAKPLLKAANLDKKNIKVFLVDRPSFNAFTDGENIFIHAGALRETKNPNELIGIIAHEIGHISLCHRLHKTEALKKGGAIAIVASTASIAALITGVVKKNSLYALAGMHASTGIVHATLLHIISDEKHQETSADKVAVSLLTKAKQSGKGLISTFKLFEKERALNYPYDSKAKYVTYSSHPMPLDRITAIQKEVKASPYYNKEDPIALQKRHDMAQAKIIGYYSQNADYINNFYISKKNPLAKDYALAFFYAKKSPDKAIEILKRLFKAEPKNPFLYELYAQICLQHEERDKALQAYEKMLALEKHPSASMYFIYSKALLQQALWNDENTPKNQKNSVQKAINLLEKAIVLEKNNPAYYSYLSTAYQDQKKDSLAMLARANMHYYKGELSPAYSLAKKAALNFKKGSPDYEKAQEIISVIEKMSEDNPS